MFLLHDVPKYETIRQLSERYPSIDPRAVEAFLVLLRTATDTLNAFESYWQRLGMSQGKFTVLMLLNRNPEQGLNPSELADKAGVTRATMTGLLDTLEKDGVIRREADVRDRRTVLVRLTETGRALLERMLPDYFECVARLMAPLSAIERKQLVALLQKIQQSATVDGNSGHVAETAGAAA